MDDGEDPGNAFAIPDLWASSRYYFDHEEPHSFLFSQLKCDDINEKLPDLAAGQVTDVGFFALPDFQFKSPELSIISTSTPPPLSERGDEINSEHGDEYVDIWSFAPEDELKSANYLTWDAFVEQKEEAPHTCYISEAGPQLFDAAVADDSIPLQIDNVDAVLVSGETYALALLALGLGRNSVLFNWNEETKAFENTLKSVRMSGFSTELTQDVTALFLRCGNTTKALQSFTDKVYTKQQSPCRVGLADAILTVLSTLQSHLNIPAQSIRSILNLQSLFRPVDNLLSLFHSLIQSATTTPNDELLLSSLYQFISQAVHHTSATDPILLEVLSIVSRPFLDFVGAWIGIQQETGVPLRKGNNGIGKSFVKAEDRIWIDDHGIEIHTPDFVLDEERVPTFMPEDDVRVMFEAGRSLRLLQECQPGHPLARGELITSATPPPVLEWEFEWQNIESIAAKARQYERDLTAAIAKYSSSGTAEAAPRQPLQPDAQVEGLSIFGKAEEEMLAHLQNSLAAFNQLPASQPTRLATLLTAFLSPPTSQTQPDSNPFALPLALTPSPSFSPLLTTHANAISTAHLRLLLSSGLRSHLALHRSFSLLGSGVFASRLSHALFAPDRSGEGNSGLRLGARRSWPPGGAELRLALSGVLRESYAASSAGSAGSSVDDLPGSLSFGIRALSAAETEACLDADSVSALDFLRLIYQPPTVLGAVLTPRALGMYDRAFRVLVSGLRMGFVCGQLFRESKSCSRRQRGVVVRFRGEAKHFVACVCAHFEEGVAAAWGKMERKMGEVEEWAVEGRGLEGGVEGLRAFHERVLERMMGVLLARKRQDGVRVVLEAVFGAILRFGSWARRKEQAASGGDEATEEELRVLYEVFRKKVRVFITACRAIQEKRPGGGEGRKSRIGEGGLFDIEEVGGGDTVGGLLARLDASGFYQS